MADAQKAAELPECPIEGGAAAEEQDGPPRPETSPTSSPTCEEPISCQSPTCLPDSGLVPPPPGLLSMPCLLKELRRDSSPEQVAATTTASASDSASVAQLRPQDDSDSSACLRSPSSSGHLGDSDTLSSAEEEETAEPTPAATGRKPSRRSRSESDASGMVMAAKKNRCQEKQVNGGRPRARAPRSQRQKERMRLLRQKREAVARRKPDLLQDSSTSDSDITAHSSSSSSSSASSDNEGGTVNSHPPVGPAVIGHYDVSDTHSDQEHQPQSLSGPVQVQPPQVSVVSSDSEVEIVGVREIARLAARTQKTSLDFQAEMRTGISAGVHRTGTQVSKGRSHPVPGFMEAKSPTFMDSKPRPIWLGPSPRSGGFDTG